MKKKYVYLIMVFLGCYINVAAQVTFNRTGVSANSAGSDVKQTLDTGYITIDGNNLIKTNVNGDTVWTRGYLYFSSSVCQTTDSGYIDVGEGLIRINSNGNVVWAKRYRLPCNFGLETSDKGYVLGGTTSFFGAGGDDFFLIKTDSVGNLSWSKTYGGSGYDNLASVQQTADSGYIMCGSTNSFSGETYLIKINTNGDTLWSKTYDILPNGSNNTSVRQTFDGGYIMTGGAGIVGNASVSLIKTDSIGNFLWSKIYRGGVDISGSNVEQTMDSGYVISGSVNDSTTNNTDIFLMKTDRNGSVLWSKAWTSGNNAQPYFNAMHQTTDGGYILSIEYFINPFGYQLSLIKTDTNGHSCGGTDYNLSLTAQTPTTITADAATIITAFSDTVITSDTVTAFGTGEGWFGCVTDAVEPLPRKQSSAIVLPNPISPDGSLTIFLNEDLKNADLTIFTITGQPLYAEKVNGKGQIILDALKNKLSAGMYFVRIMQGEKMMVVKFVVMN